MKKFLVLILMLTLLLCAAQSHLTPQQAISQMERGINIGNSLDATPNETSWGNPLIRKYYFDDYASAGFKCVRIPITWKYHTSGNSPYTIDKNWLDRVDTVVSWGLSKGLYIIINAHHEDGLKATDTMKNLIAKADTLAKYDSIWSQVATHFKDKSDHLLFEILNEPNPMSQTSVDLLNARILSIIRKTNPTRIVIYSGNAYAGSDQLIAAKIPDPVDTFLIGYYHSYDPYNFAGLAIGTYGSSSDINSTISRFNQVTSWSTTKHIPVTLDECGAVQQCDYNSRMIYYATFIEQALNHKVAFNVWDDNGSFQTYIRSSRQWNDLKDVIIHTYKESPTQLKAFVVDTTVTISWLNRTTLNDSIFLDRRTAGTVFAPIAILNSTATQFHDSALLRNTVYYYRLRTRLLDSIDLYSYPVAANILGVRKPFLGHPLEVPGTIQAEDFDLGGLNVAYYTSGNTNQGGAYRLTEGVGIEARPDSGYQLDYVSSGEWTSYSVYVSQKALYRIDVYTASLNGGGTYNFKIGAKTTKSVVVPKTNDWTSLVASSTYAVSLDTGIQVLYFNIVSGTNTPFNIDRFVFVQDTSSTVINDQKLNSNFSVFPNPAVTKVVIKMPESNNQAKLNIYNIIGIKIQSKILTNSETTLSVEGMDKGIYLFVLTTNKGSEIKRIIVQK